MEAIYIAALLVLAALSTCLFIKRKDIIKQIELIFIPKDILHELEYMDQQTQIAVNSGKLDHIYDKVIEEIEKIV